MRDMNPHRYEYSCPLSTSSSFVIVENFHRPFPWGTIGGGGSCFGGSWAPYDGGSPTDWVASKPCSSRITIMVYTCYWELSIYVNKCMDDCASRNFIYTALRSMQYVVPAIHFNTLSALYQDYYGNFIWNPVSRECDVHVWQTIFNIYLPQRKVMFFCCCMLRRNLVSIDAQWQKINHNQTAAWGQTVRWNKK